MFFEKFRRMLKPLTKEQKAERRKNRQPKKEFSMESWKHGPRKDRAKKEWRAKRIKELTARLQGYKERVRLDSSDYRQFKGEIHNCINAINLHNIKLGKPSKRLRAASFAPSN